MGVLTQKLGTEPHPVAYLSKKLDGTVLGWPGCLRVIAATALLVEEAMKITMDQQLEVLTPYQVSATLELKSHLWMSGERLTKHQTILLESPEVTIKTCNVLNLVSLLLSKLMTEHTCKQVIAQTYASGPDLTDQPLLEPEAEWFTDRSSFVLNGERKASYAVVSHEEVIEAWPLPAGTSAQKAELIALIRALTLGKGKRLNIYTDSKYAFLVLLHSCSYMEENRTPLWEVIPNNTWKGNFPIIRGYPSTKESGSNPLPGT
jgi:hypothetical protein